MLKFIRGKGQQPSAERQRLQKELFSYRKTAQHGFPHKPSALAYDPVLKLMAIGTQTGAIKVFGQPGVEFYGQHTLVNNSPNELNVQLLEWVYGTGRLLSLTAANQLILWEPVGTSLVAIKTLPFDGKLKKVSSLCCSLNKDLVWIGTEGGNIYQLDLNTFSIREPVIYHDVVLEQVPPVYKLNPGAIESIRQLPNALNKLMIAYNRGLCVLFDLDASSVVRAYIAPGHGQSVGLFLNANGTQFTWYHADGSFATWNVTNADPPKNVNYVPYGPDPCKSINRLYKGNRGSTDLIIFSGGMPRSAYGDHNCVSVHANDGKKVCLDFTSKVIDFFVTYKGNTDVAQVLIVLLEEELCAYDLTDPKVPALKAPYLHSVHASAVTCNYLASHVSHDVYKKIAHAGEEQDADYSSIEWPINGGVFNDDSTSNGIDIDNEENLHEILLTGHEDGSVKFWDCTTVVLKPIYHFKTALLFGHENEDGHMDGNAEPLDDSEPPFRKAGLFDPYSDDPRLAVKKVSLCPKTGVLIVGGTAGQIVIASFDVGVDDDNRNPLKVSSMNLVSDRDGFVWKGHDQLNVRANLLEENADGVGDVGVHITGVLQVLPPASITCLALEANWGVVSGGTAHGLVLFDFKNFLPVFHRCTLNPNDLTGAGEQLSRRKSFKKSLRESFRKLRKGRSTRNNPTQQVQTTLDARPVERQVEARSAVGDDGMGSMVRCLLFAKTYITNVNLTSPTLWSATNSSTVSVFLLHLPPVQTAATATPPADAAPQPPRRVSAQLAKEIQLKHRAPVVGISIFDQTGSPVDECNGSASAPPHRLLIASEEQFKVFSLPQLKPINKYKLTANEGARVRRIHFGSFSCRVPPEIIQAAGGSSPTKSTRSHGGDGDGVANISVASGGGDVVPDARIYHEMALLCLTNLGDIMVLSVPELKRQLNAAAVRREDINGISSLCFTNGGEALYMMSSSELQRISLASSKVITPSGSIHVEPLVSEEIASTSAADDDDDDADSVRESNVLRSTTTTVTTTKTTKADDAFPVPKERIKPLEVNTDTTNLTNGIGGGGSINGGSSGNSPNRANETITSSVGDITVDSVRDHLNATTTTLCSTTTEETVGRLSVLSTQTHQTLTSVNMKDIPDINITNLMDLAPNSDTTETNSSSVVIKSIITSISHEKTNGETETVTTKTTTHEESQF